MPNKTLRDVLPPEFFLEHGTSLANRYLDVEVVRDNKDGERWPGTHKNVYAFWVLANGKRVGWNENPGRGWSFPVV